VFFFQAEDGIRDFHVTGVQTCALPISVELALRPSALAEPGVYTGVVTGWTADTALGPVFRLVTTVIRADTGETIAADLGALAAGATGRAFFEATAARPFALAVSTAEPAEQVLVYLHEPGGQPYRERAE